MLNFSLKWLERLVMAMSIVVAVTCAYFLMNDDVTINTFLRPNEKNREPIGQVVTVEKDVRKKSKSSLMWLVAKSDMQVYENDSIFTGQGSRVTLKIGDDFEFEIGENSLVTLQTENNQLELDLKLGSFKSNFKSGKSFRILQNGISSKVKANDGQDSVEIKKFASGGVLLGPNASLEDERSKLRQADDYFDVSKVEVNSPSDGELIFPNDKMEQYFEITMNARPNNFWAQVSLRSNFDSLEYDRPVLEKRFQFKGLPTGRKYYWRLVRKNNDDFPAVIKKGMVYYVSTQPPSPRYPINGVAIKVPDLKDGETYPVSFAWSQEFQANKYQVEIALDARFTSLIYKDFANQPYIKDLDLQESIYFWRVRSLRDKFIISDWSKAASFYMGRPEKLKAAEVLSYLHAQPPKVPKLEAVQYDSVIKVDSKELKNAKSKEARLRISPPFTWTDSPTAYKYNLEVSLSPDFKNVVKEVETRDNVVYWEDFEPGTYYWRVKAQGFNGLESQFSNIGKMQIKIDNTKLAERYDLAVNKRQPANDKKKKVKKDEAVEVSWQNVELADSYVVLLSEDLNFDKVVEKQIVKSNKAKLRPPREGHYFMKVAPLNSRKEVVGDYSNIADLFYIFDYKLAAPQVHSPKDGVTILNLDARQEGVVLYWEKNNFAQDYVVQLSRDQQFRQVLFEVNSKDPSLFFKEDLEPGPLFWRVRSRTPSSVSQWSPARTINVKAFNTTTKQERTGN